MSTLVFSVARELDRIRLSAELSVRGSVAIAGRSGAGKTSLLRVIAGLDNGAAGHIEVDGIKWLSGKTNVAPEARSVGYLGQESGLFPNLTALDNVAFALQGKANRRRDRARGLLAHFGLEELVSARPVELSGGQRRRVALVRAVAGERAVYLLDEPFASLDARAAQTSATALQDLLNQRASPALITCHEVTTASLVCDRIVTLEAGRVVSDSGIGSSTGQSAGRSLDVFSDRLADRQSVQAHVPTRAPELQRLPYRHAGSRAGSR